MVKASIYVNRENYNKMVNGIVAWMENNQESKALKNRIRLELQKILDLLEDKNDSFDEQRYVHFYIETNEYSWDVIEGSLGMHLEVEYVY